MTFYRHPQYLLAEAVGPDYRDQINPNQNGVMESPHKRVCSARIYDFSEIALQDPSMPVRTHREKQTRPVLLAINHQLLAADRDIGDYCAPKLQG